MSNFNIFKLALHKGVDNTRPLCNRGFWQYFLHIKWICYTSSTLSTSIKAESSIFISCTLCVYTYQYTTRSKVIIIFSNHISNFWSPTNNKYAFPWSQCTFAALHKANLMNQVIWQGGEIFINTSSHWITLESDFDGRSTMFFSRVSFSSVTTLEDLWPSFGSE